jgi:hypothetical protein
MLLDKGDWDINDHMSISNDIIYDNLFRYISF